MRLAIMTMKRCVLANMSFSQPCCKPFLTEIRSKRDIEAVRTRQGDLISLITLSP
jgi:hypothetical protein